MNSIKEKEWSKPNLTSPCTEIFFQLNVVQLYSVYTAQLDCKVNPPWAGPVSQSSFKLTNAVQIILSLALLT